MEIAVVLLTIVVLVLAALLFMALRRRPPEVQPRGLQEMRDNIVAQLNLLGGQMKQDVGQLSEAARNMQSLGENISGLLQSPKLRGQLGELMLEQLLEKVLPSDFFGLQHAFRDGTKVDAAIFLTGGAVPVDAKFPVESFQRMVSAGEDGARARREFESVVRKHIDAVALYIRPDEGTLDFALMYIPSESVYYEAVVRSEGPVTGKSISEHARERRVVPVSPSTFYLYLQSVAWGLRGLRIEASARTAWDSLLVAQKGLGRLLAGDLAVLGKHISNVQGKFEDLRRGLERLDASLQSLKPPEEPVALANGQPSREVS